MILVDSSVWVAFFKRQAQELPELIEQGRVLIHPYIIGELTCGTPPQRATTLAWLNDFEFAKVATHDECLLLAEQFHGQGIGWVDVCLLASSQISDARLWTFDTRLHSAARSLDLHFIPHH